MDRQEKAIVIFSGGQDSTTCLFWAKREFAEVEAVTFDYGQRHRAEIDCARRIAEEQNVPWTLLDMGLLNQLAPNALTRSGMAIEHREGELPNTFVDGRNMLFLTFAAIVAKQRGARHLVTGVCETDFSGYPDCRDIFIKSLNVTLNLAMDYSFFIHTPLMRIDKAATWKLADELGVFDYIRTNTITCYNGIPGDGCGECPSCKLRLAGMTAYLAERERLQSADAGDAFASGAVADGTDADGGSGAVPARQVKPV
ncbi:7-cyano-7-deazaguanine synthase QueC [Paenibacillus cisolokensis]|uniref:7-cyano-7-deazaguanine synthase QueC n=1 Tax=Paenibacillus cisolokensis TaxID=1658519 RepID=UPI003D27596D